MRDQFPGYYRLSDEDLETLWKECVFVLDANVLLNLYRYPENARDDLLNALDRVKDRIWLPFHAALEFQRNRPSVIAGQKSTYDDVRKAIKSSIQSLESSFTSLDVRKRHANIDPDELMNRVKPIFDEYTKKLDELERGQFDVHQEDPIRIKIDSLFHQRIGPTPGAKEIDKITVEARERYQNKIPPGYLDQPKDGTDDHHFTYGGISYPNSAGDLIIWKQIIQHAKSIKAKSIVFLTDDEKEDWWWSISSGGKKSLGPRPELVEEISREASVEKFHMYTSERFLKFAEKYLAAKIRESSIEDVKFLKSIPPADDFFRFGQSKKDLDHAFTRYLSDEGFVMFQMGFDEPKILAFNHGESAPWRFDIISDHSSERDLRNRVLRVYDFEVNSHIASGLNELRKGEIQGFKILWAFSTDAQARKAFVTILQKFDQLDNDVEIVFGFIDTELLPEFQGFIPVVSMGPSGLKYH